MLYLSLSQDKTLQCTAPVRVSAVLHSHCTPANSIINRQEHTILRLLTFGIAVYWLYIWRYFVTLTPRTGLVYVCGNAFFAHVDYKFRRGLRSALVSNCSILFQYLKDIVWRLIGHKFTQTCLILSYSYYIVFPNFFGIILIKLLKR